MIFNNINILHKHVLHAVLYDSTPSYNGVLRRFLLIVKSYSFREMFVAHDIPSFYKLQRKCIYSFRERISHSVNKFIKACLSPIVCIHSPIRQWWRSVLHSF